MAMQTVNVTDRGFENDRRWMLVDENNVFLTQRKLAAMALLSVKITPNGLYVYHTINGNSITIDRQTGGKQKVNAQIWDDECEVQLTEPAIDEWFSDMLSARCRLVYMPDTTKRAVDEAYRINSDITSLSDGYPVLIIGQQSINDLNRRLITPVPMNRFRPNIVFTGGHPYIEDDFKAFTINDVGFMGVKLCGRCLVTTIDQKTGHKSAEPLKTLSSYRTFSNKINFGQNLLLKGRGTVSVGQTIEIESNAI